MTERSRYAATALVLIGLAAAVAWPLMGSAAWLSLLTVGLLAFVLQVSLFAMLSSAHGDPNRLMKSWALGMVGRVSFVVAVGVVVTLAGLGDDTVAILSAVGFVFALHLIEPVFLGTPKRNEYAR